MTDGQIFLIVFVALYLSDCFYWGGRTALAFLSKGRRRWRMRRPGDGFGNDRGGLLFLWPLPPLGTAFLTDGTPLAFSDEGVGTVRPESPNPGPRVPGTDEFVRWEAIESVSVEEKWILINEVKFFKCAGPVQARLLGKRILRWRKKNIEIRRHHIGALLHASFDRARVERLVRLYGRAVGFLRFLANALVVACFVGVPLAYWYWQATRPFFVFLVVIPMLMIQVTIEAFRLHRRRYPTARSERWIHVCIQLFVPQFAMRALDPVARHFLWRFHPLAVAAALLDRKDFEAFAGGYYRDLRNPLPFHIGSEAAATAATFFLNDHLRPNVEDFLRREGLDLETLTGPPESREDEARGYCPRCRAQFIIDGGICDPCSGMAARSL
jgi:hypothetical protein